MDHGNLNARPAKTRQWGGWASALIGGVVGLLLASAFWGMQRYARSRPQPPQQRDLSRLGQAPSRSRIQLSTHPARQELWR
jgi:hypothetical protein